MTKFRPFWVYLGIAGILIIVLVYSQGLATDATAVGPYAIQALALAQGRNPATFGFSNYPGTNANGTGS